MRVWPLALGALALADAADAYVIPDIEPVYGVTVTRQAVTVRMAANGCARKSDLTVAVAKTQPRPTILIARKHPEACAADPRPMEVVYSLEDLGLTSGQAFTVANPLISDPNQ